MKFTATLKKHINLKFKYMNMAFGRKPFQLLDVGAGNQSASKTKVVFPNCEYHGLDMDRNTNYIKEDFMLMNNFYELDLTKLDLSAVPDNYFDYINMAHVIEHLENGDKVLPLLISKLKKNGYFYIEYPGAKSLNLPSMYDTLNFYDDKTHKRVYSVSELTEIFKTNNCTIIESGTRRNWYYILAMPFRMIHSFVTIRKIRGNIFWDITGFAEYLFVKKN